MLTRIGLALAALITLGWIVTGPFLVGAWQPHGLLRVVATWVDVPAAVWLAGLGWMILRRRRSPRS